MTNEQIVELGLFIETLLLDPKFNTLTAAFEQTQVQSLLSTKLPDKESRERIYATIQGVRDFLNFAAEIRTEAERLTTPEDLDKKRLDIIDDPSVHNIYD